MRQVYITGRMPDGTLKLWSFGDVDDDQLGDLLVRAQIVCGLEAGKAKLGDVSVHEATDEEPLHDALLGRVEHAGAAELHAVDAELVAAFHRDLEQYVADSQKRAAREALAALTPEQLDELLEEHRATRLGTP